MICILQLCPENNPSGSVALVDGYRPESVDVMKKKMLLATVFTFETHKDTLTFNVAE